MSEYGDGHCAVCDRKVRAGMLMCRTHWKRVPYGLRVKVYAKLAKWLNGGCTLQELRDVQDAAVAAVMPSAEHHRAHAGVLIGSRDADCAFIAAANPALVLALLDLTVKLELIKALSDHLRTVVAHVPILHETTAPEACDDVADWIDAILAGRFDELPWGVAKP